MQRRALGTICLGLLVSLTACTGPGTSGTSTVQPENDEGVGGEEMAGSVRNPTAERTGPLPGGEAVSCVESYSPAALNSSDFAFDGVALTIGPSVSDRGDGGDLGLPGVRFEVLEWFSGGSAETVTVDMQTLADGAAASPNGEPAYEVGSRLLVSGASRWGGAPLDAPIAWGCGFSRYYDEQTASTWRDAFDR